MRFSSLIVLLAASGCATFQRQDFEKVVARTLITDSQETQLGLQVHQELVDENVKFSDNLKVRLYVENLAKKLIVSANKERKLDWKFFVIDDPETINAFATPGGRIYVYTGLLLAAENEAQVVGVLGHEIGHVVGRHSARQLVAAKGMETVGAMVSGAAKSEIVDLVHGLTGQGTMLAYGRDMELESDRYGARYSSAAGYDPRGIAGFFKILQDKYGDTPKLMTYLSTHPANSDRIQKVNELVKTENLRGSNLAPESLAAIKAELNK